MANEERGDVFGNLQGEGQARSAEEVVGEDLAGGVLVDSATQRFVGYVPVPAVGETVPLLILQFQLEGGGGADGSGERRDGAETTCLHLDGNGFGLGGGLGVVFGKLWRQEWFRCNS